MAGARSNDSLQNRLGKEKSPYLLQHANNPVDWYPWGNEAIERAHKERKPIFLSIGYSSCHWCHVMERESFEDLAVAKLLNDDFVCIKVDREERPDIDEIYMKAVIALTGQGGWPLSVFLTPELEPFYGGTYFPPVARYGMPAFPSLLRSISRAWKSEQQEIIDSAGRIKTALNEAYSQKSNSVERLNGDPIQGCYAILSGEYDELYGGFGTAPKFPSPSNLFFLMRFYSKTGKANSLKMVVGTLDAMAKGGIYDHVGGGFHRYSTDREWLVPHFEKMLYDNALLVMAYTEGYQITGNENYKRVVEETLTWVLNEMTSLEGGFRSAQDADSPDGEGAYYVWSREDVANALIASGDDHLKDKANMICDYYSIGANGDFENGRSVLKIAGSQSGELNPILKSARDSMFKFRANRPKPSTDDKILASWNGMMISAMSRAYRVCSNRDFLNAALRAAEFILANLTRNENDMTRLVRRFRDREAAGSAVLEDYAFVINGFLDLYEACYDAKYLEWSIDLCKQMITDFYDSDSGGFFMSTADSQNLISRAKVAEDGAVPSGNSDASLALIRLAELTSNQDFREKAHDTIRAFWSSLESQPSSYSFMLVSLNFILSKTKEIVISGERGSVGLEELVYPVNQKYLPNSVLAYAEERVVKLVPMVEGRVWMRGQKPRVFVCTNYSCKLPATTRAEVIAALDE